MNVLVCQYYDAVIEAVAMVKDKSALSRLHVQPEHLAPLYSWFLGPTYNWLHFNIIYLDFEAVSLKHVPRDFADLDYYKPK